MIWDSPALQITGIGFFLATTIVGSTLLGRWLDDRYGTDPVFTLVLLSVGLLAGLYGAITQLRDVLRAIERRRLGEQQAQAPDEPDDDVPRW